MLIVALVLAVIGLAALVTALVTSNELFAWVCIGASVLGVLLLIIDAIRERQARDRGVVAVDATAGTGAAAVGAGVGQTVDETYQTFDEDYPDEVDANPADTVTEVQTSDEPVTAVVPAVDPVVETTADPETEVHYVTADDADAGIEVHYVTAEEPDTVIEYVTDTDDVTGDDTRD